MSGPTEPLQTLWDDAYATTLSPSERLIYRSNLLGSAPQITNTGGGNTSAKLLETDPFSGEAVEVLWVKGSGGDLRTSKLANFASLYQHKLLTLQDTYNSRTPRGPKTEAEDAMAACYPHCAFNLNPRAASIDTPLHAFVPYRQVDHVHPNAVIAIAASRRSRQLTREVYGDEVGWTPWLRPGFELGLELERRCRAEPQLKGMVLGQHGLINWADGDRECYDLTLGLINRAAGYIEAHDKGEATFGGEKYGRLTENDRHEILFTVLPWLRRRVASGRRSIGVVNACPPMQRFVNSHHAARLAELGTSCPDHFLRTKIKPLYIPWDPATQDVQALQELLESGLEQYRRDYAAYYERCKRPDSPAMRDPNPTVILIPGIGMIAWGKNRNEARITSEFYECAVEVMRGAEAIDEYIALPEQEAFDIEYWQLEEAKLRRMPPEEGMSRRVVLIARMDRNLGEALMRHLGWEGAEVRWGDVRETVLEYGGLDHAVIVGDAKLIAEAAQVWERQGWPGSLVTIDMPAPALPLLRANELRVMPGASIEAQVETIVFLLSDRSSGIDTQVITVAGCG